MELKEQLKRISEKAANYCGQALLGLAREGSRVIYYRNPKKIFELCQNHQNPDFFKEDFSGGLEKWRHVWVDFNEEAILPTGQEPARVLVEDSSLKLQVTHDQNFEAKRKKWRRKKAAAERYNNAFLIGAQGFMPTKDQEVVIETNMKITPDFHGSTGIWMEEEDTFNDKGVMEKPFRSFGFSFLGSQSDPYIRGLAIETCLGLSLQEKISLPEVDLTKPHDYKMVWKWKNEKEQIVDFYIDNGLIGSLTMAPIGQGEIQVWADNYWIKKGMAIDYLNPPEGVVDENRYSYIKVYQQKISTNAGYQNK